jgi:C-terminal processing protease CtpA/Prc
MRTLTLVTIGLVLSFVVTAAPLSAAGSPDPQTNQPEDTDPRLGFRRMLRGPGSALGATVRDLTAAELDDQSALNGVLIDGVQPNSPASRAGLQEGDVVIELDDELVRNARQFESLVRDTPPGWTVEATIVRDGIERGVSLTMVPDLG